MRSGKWHSMEVIEIPDQEKTRMLGEKETYKFLGILEKDIIKQVEMKGNIFKKSQENGKTTGNQTMLQKSYQRDKPLRFLPRKILGTILKVNEGRTSTNGQEIKKTHDVPLHLRDNVHKQYVSKKEEEENFSALKIALIHWCNDSKTI